MDNKFNEDNEFNSQVQNPQLKKQKEEFSNLNPNSTYKNYLKNIQNVEIESIKRANQVREYFNNVEIQANQIEQQMQEQQEENSVTNGMSDGVKMRVKTEVKKEADSKLKKELVDIIMKKLLTEKVLMVLGIVSVIIVFLIMCILIITSVKDDESEVNTSNDVIDVVKGELGIEEITEYLVQLGICRDLVDDTEEQVECANSGYGRFLKDFNIKYNEYKNYIDKYNQPIELDIPLILETLSYGRTDNDFNRLLESTEGYNKAITDLNELSEALVEHIQEYGDLYTLNGSTCSVKKDQLIDKPYYRISDDKYISYLKYGKVHENYSGKVRMWDASIHPGSHAKCIPEGLSYSPPSDERYIGKEVADENNNDNSDNDPNGNENTVTGNGIGVQVANYALRFVGNPYVWGGTSLTNGADCSGFTMKIFEHFGISLPHHSTSQANYGKNIGTNVSNAIPGDLIVYNHNHVAIYIGDNKIVHAASKKSGIKVGNKADYKSILSIRRLVE